MPKKASIDPQRQLMIKTKACQRLIKEVAYYEKEVKENEATLKDMEDAGKDPYDIKKFKEVLGESYMMVPDSKSRMNDAVKDLAEYIESPEVTTLEDTGEWYVQAKDLLAANQKATSGNDDDGAVQETDVGDLKEGEVF